MRGNDAKIDAFFSRLDSKMRRAVPHIIAEKATAYYKSSFTSKSWDGKAWPSAKKPPGRGSLMVRSGKLVSSIRPGAVTANKVTISAGSSKVPYARIHNEGLRVNKLAKVGSFTNSNFMGKGKSVRIKSHSRQMNYTMPRRQFMGRSDKLNREIINVIKREFKII